MSERDEYPAGVPCWVETLQPDAQAARDFYGAIFGWQFAGPCADAGEYVVARVRGRDVAGVGSTPDPGATSVPTAWLTQVRVASVEAAAERAVEAGGSVLAGPIDARPAGRLVVLADPAGAAIGVWEAADREGAQVVNEPRAWAMSMLHTPDPAGAVAFYGAVFGWETEIFEAGDGMQVTLWRLPGYVGGEPQQPVPRDVVGAMGLAGDGVPPHWSVDFWVDDAIATAARAGELGGDVVAGPFDAPPFRRAVIADPQGAAFSVSQHLAAPAG
ncbi:MAG TPA: VOC family protein [Solirubrobacteraceae bacterium]|jgi:predicted enzyme related to lactoylglutathione lyase|nr:VOC family protein [Solirubrobacteraceae bacterium]